MKTLRFLVVDVFTDRPLAGNQLAVFTDARGISAALMQRLARETNFSETVFVLPPAEGGHAKVRIFTPQREIPFAGHPTLGTAFVLGGPMHFDEIVLETGRGKVPVRLEREGAKVIFGRMLQPTPAISPYPEAQQLLQILGLSRSELPIERYDNGLKHVLVHASSLEEVANLKPQLNLLEGLEDICFSVFYAEGATGKTRMFAPGGGVAEDPATGSAAGPIALHLVRHGRLAPEQELKLSQGAELLRPSTLYARIMPDGSPLGRIEVEAGSGRRAGEYLNLESS